jgi:hypothetical protein
MNIQSNDDGIDLDENVDPSSSDGNIHRSSNTAIASGLSPGQDQPIEKRDAFERSSEEDGEVIDPEIIRIHEI